MARTYGDRCGVARALDLVGERWALLVVRELLLGPKRFTDLRAGLPQVGPDVLSQRLRELEAAGIVARRTLDPPASAKVYALTPRGARLEPVILELGRFGSTAPFPDGDPTFGSDALALALKTLYEPGGPAATVTLRLAGQDFRVRTGEGPLELARGAADEPDATIEAEPGPLAAVLWHGADPAGIEITGDRRAAARFLKRFPLPA
ncbi:MAG TPA: helix-turn-helix domain-containing protein [Solirubrobacteraceae bacterium]|nr:helix-turn-helix domain-containing protein [Solirubrobacteraceae bacterium]